MAVAEGMVSEVRSDGSGRLLCPRAIQPEPGQYLLASGFDPCEASALALFPAGLPGEDLPVAVLPPAWSAGTRLRLRGPLGQGFSLPPSARQVALVALGCSALLLLALAEQALAQGAAVALLCAQAPEGLPQAIEVLPLELLPETSLWADALGAAFAFPDLAQFRRLAGLRIHQRFTCPAQALLLTPLACAGMAACGICTVPTPRGYRLACTDGPVFNLNELELL